MNWECTLAPAHRVAAKELLDGISTTAVLVLRSNPGKGRTTVLRAVHNAAGGALIGCQDWIITLHSRHPAAIEEAFVDVLKQQLQAHALVFVDDFHLLRSVVDGYEYPRQRLLDAMLAAVLDTTEATHKTIVFGIDCDAGPGIVGERAQFWKIGEFTPFDYEFVCLQNLTCAGAAALDFERIHRFAPMLNLWQLKNACRSLSQNSEMDTDKFLEYLSAHNLISNVDIQQVRQVDLNDIKGLDDVIQALEAKIALPLENPVLAAELDLKPRRGVLLAGPPGTGKTTIGRALAHRLKSKFFLIDGTAICGSGDFYSKISLVFRSAKKNAPAIIFIDDADVMFQGEGDQGLYRYLLTMLDGLESASSERVCVMMTAMDPASLPPALLRSGRVELWLETRLPDADARATIFRESLESLPVPMCEVDCSLLATASHGLTGADLRSVVEDGKLLFAYDKTNRKPLRPIEEYFLEAIETVRENRRNYAKRRPHPFKEVVKIGFDSANTA
jgi:ATP-dependent 26S proteasome regulatory subunit